ncbi:MAG: endonuclease [Treponema sp.]|jgi:endonuclease/exonuclease/phosphatase family metal-dependent hydrolase|nr:endonuclease [Treponema sp.]
MKKTLLIIPLLLFLGFYRAGAQGKPETVKIASFNIQIFGAAKMAKTEAAELLAEIVSGFDMVAIQEVRSAGIEPVERFMAMLPERYGYVLGPREGRSSSKEQYWTIYDKTKFTALAQDVWPDADDIFEREPMAVYFKTAGTFDFILINNHIQPREARKEIAALPEVAAYYRELWKDPDLLILGDFNADGQYYDESLLAEVFPEGEYLIVITNEYDTTLGAGNNTYDRFIISSSAREDYTGAFGVIRFDEVYDFSRRHITPREVSDHYPIWAEFWTNRDTD